jgi:hypothetical protein
MFHLFIPSLSSRVSSLLQATLDIDLSWAFTRCSSMSFINYLYALDLHRLSVSLRYLLRSWISTSPHPSYEPLSTDMFFHYLAFLSYAFISTNSFPSNVLNYSCAMFLTDLEYFAPTSLESLIFQKQQHNPNFIL